MTYYVIDDSNNILATETVRPAEGAYPGRRVVFSTKNYFDTIPASAVASDITSGIVALAQSTVGVKLTDLTAAQIKVLIACLLKNAGAVNDDLTIKPLKEWM